jgi:signal transduction histidine kinase
MSMIAVQAETARYRISGLSEAATDEFAALSDAAREGLTDLRRLLGVLRSDAPAEREPQPQLGDLIALVEATRRAGVTVELSMPDNGGASVSAAVGLCAYRVVQEALSNAGRHAPGASVSVAVARDPRALRVNIVNGPPVTPAATVSADGRPGHGIAGMSERVTLLGGSLTAIPHGEGGFAVSATLPLVGGAGQ